MRVDAADGADGGAPDAPTIVLAVNVWPDEAQTVRVEWRKTVPAPQSYHLRRAQGSAAGPFEEVAIFEGAAADDAGLDVPGLVYEDASGATEVLLVYRVVADTAGGPIESTLGTAVRWKDGPSLAASGSQRSLASSLALEVQGGIAPEAALMAHRAARSVLVTPAPGGGQSVHEALSAVTLDRLSTSSAPWGSTPTPSRAATSTSRSGRSISPLATTASTSAMCFAARHGERAQRHPRSGDPRGRGLRPHASLPPAGGGRALHSRARHRGGRRPGHTAFPSMDHATPVVPEDGGLSPSEEPTCPTDDPASDPVSPARYRLDTVSRRRNVVTRGLGCWCIGLNGYRAPCGGTPGGSTGTSGRSSTA